MSHLNNMHTNSCQGNDKEFLFSGSEKPPIGFSVPDGYFENFEQKMLEKIKETPTLEKTPVLKPMGIQKILSVMAIAASMIWAVFVFFTPEEKLPASSLNTNFVEVEELGMDDFYGVNDDVLAEHLSLAELAGISFDENYVSEEDIYEYVLAENYSEFEILENL